ncbi:MAG: KOW domain-containing RNA-binding protein [Lachnospiraceae bacterium]|nr:KOW domain-containing RNA-binding protein [Lachnospiraceae bacterium]
MTQVYNDREGTKNMNVWTSKMLAMSLAGHDKGSLYVVLEEKSGTDGTDSYLLSDGKHRTLSHPKRKNAKHVQLITHLPDTVLARMQEITLDAHVRKILKNYSASVRQQDAKDSSGIMIEAVKLQVKQ